MRLFPVVLWSHVSLTFFKRIDTTILSVSLQSVVISRYICCILGDCFSLCGSSVLFTRTMGMLFTLVVQLEANDGSCVFNSTFYVEYMRKKRSEYGKHTTCSLGISLPNAAIVRPRWVFSDGHHKRNENEAAAHPRFRCLGTRCFCFGSNDVQGFGTAGFMHITYRTFCT